ncbi:hypothetical protein HELRODRAFT_113553 [Helobdella robusta]|uniref:L-Fucosyltransferase n=1 Tax=Helobdella robusta TaxID=6412 RepID=T1EFT5_HELRO|nr:hypothetical protein HELRODRAFT_113553 [Helobdella robusta]ESN99787.1 hypothetical protein HELRODRAFT_113553 [Helobdella robusta]
MFQYAALYGIGRANGLKPVIVEGSSVAKVFYNLKCQIEFSTRQIRTFQNEYEYLVYYERRSNMFDSRTFSLNFMKNIRISGYFQSWRYFDHARTDIRKQFSSFGLDVTRDVNDFIKTSVSSFIFSSDEQQPDRDDIKLVGVHVRRGDFLDEVNVKKGYGVADKYFFRRAMDFFVGKFKKVIFIVCSEDEKWIKKNIKSSAMVVFSPFGMSPERDLMLLANCNHTIISGGSFGWWGAWLAQGLTVYSQKFPEPESELSLSFRMSDYYLPQWIPM